MGWRPGVVDAASTITPSQPGSGRKFASLIPRQRCPRQGQPLGQAQVGHRTMARKRQDAVALHQAHHPPQASLRLVDAEYLDQPRDDGVTIHGRRRSDPELGRPLLEQVPYAFERGLDGPEVGAVDA